MTATVHELLNGIVKVRTAGADRRIFARWAERYAGDTRRSYETFRIDDVRVVFEGAFPTAMVLILFATVVLIGREAVPAAAFMGFYVALGQLQTAVVNVARSTVTLLEVRPVLDQARPILEEATESDTARTTRVGSTAASRSARSPSRIPGRPVRSSTACRSRSSRASSSPSSVRRVRASRPCCA